MEQTPKKKYSQAGVKAQSYARVELIKRHRAEYDEIYRAKMIELGGTPKPTTQEKIEMLKQQIEKLQVEMAGE
jgi:DNA-binding SARP family transcriptional activator